jgi:hypothetical protein
LNSVPVVAMGAAAAGRLQLRLLHHTKLRSNE